MRAPAPDPPRIRGGTTWGRLSTAAPSALQDRANAVLARRHPPPDQLRELLAVDPLTVLRCLRVACSPIDASRSDRRPRLPGIQELYERLGPENVRRALARPGRGVPCPALHALWLHAVAAAHAARELAGQRGLDGDVAYVLGLLHDLPLWLHHLCLAQGERLAAAGATEWIRAWQLPAELETAVLQAWLGTPADSREQSGDSLLRSAERLAELAGFRHPEDDHPASLGLLRATAPAGELEAAERLRRRVEEVLRRCGISNSAPSAGQPPGFVRPSSDRSDELVAEMLGHRSLSRYADLIHAALSAALRFLDFDRAHYVLWGRDGYCHVRAREGGPAGFRPVRVAIDPVETRSFDEACRTGATVLLRSRETPCGGLLGRLGADEALVAPVNRDLALASFLVLDRSLSGQPIKHPEDAFSLQTLAGTTSLLIANMLLQRRHQRTEKFALTDPLTRLFNRGVGIQRLGQELARAKRAGAPLTVLMLDLDDFKILNDTRGHLVGDMALREAANVIAKSLRRSDTVCRYGGEEFLVILPDTSLEEASVSATRIFTAVQEAGERLDLPLTVSIGLATVHPESDTVESVLTRADRALYASKSRGRNRFSIDER